MRRTDARTDPLRSPGRDLAKGTNESDMGAAADLAGDYAEAPLAAWELAWIDLGGEG